MRHLPVKERDIAALAAFELSLQYLVVRQDRYYYLYQFCTALFSFVFCIALVLGLTSAFLFPVTSYKSLDYFVFQPGYLYSIIIVVLLVLLFIQTSKKKFEVEPGEETIDRLNRDILEPCLGLKFDVESGRLFTDGRTFTKSNMSFYELRYKSS
ncbi:hypothetical protein AGDE_05270 [Angomonas deanei]|uniref:Uncharacterized protein n=1 Tax=Angomonas deanei TaxID=59799 RepID=A0A7G2CDL5_9TRYP|nr:hypothetical protein AGDE_05270 [Angomonas deanei]CAD2217930.1 hypothetical protein, conserved [Angomonas deanei]|eukprot:EPY38659.1 hypothetical protein AGDE_05270 [Angomonas deanei]